MSKVHLPWINTSQFHQVRKYAQKALGSSAPKVTYKSKVKLHGTNAAIQVHPDGTIVCQSRNNIITPERDNDGFARWVEENKEAWSESKTDKLFVVYGEFCGGNIQNGVALNQIKEKQFAIFALYFVESDYLEVRPEKIRYFVPELKNVHIIPWHPLTVTVDYCLTSEYLTALTEEINQEVLRIEACDPWVKDNFGFEGLGEGLVFYPLGFPTKEKFSEFAFKAKGEKHRTVTAKPATVTAASAESVTAFAELVVTPARLEQGVRAISDGQLTFDIKKVGEFIGWICKDVQKETACELEESDLTWKAVSGAVSLKARGFYINECRK